MALRGHWVGLLLAAELAACGRRTAATKDGRDTPENQALMRKVDGYMQCNSDHSELVFRLEHQYRDRFSAAPPADGADVVFPKLSDPKQCLEAITSAKALAPALPEVDAAGAAFGTALTNIHRLTTSYKPAQAARSHPELLAAFDAFDHAQAALFDHVYRINRQVHIAQFAERVRVEGRTLATMIEDAQLRAEDLVRFAATPSSQLDKLDVAALSTSLAGLERSLGELNAYEASKPDEAKAVANFYGIVEHANKLALAARQLVHRARGNVAYSDSEKLMIAAGNEAGVVGTPGALAHAYNRMIELR